MDASVAGDLSALAHSTWHVFLQAFVAQADCIGSVRLRASTTLGSRGAYDSSTATVIVRVPASAAMLRGTLVHEWAHHVEYSCASHSALRPAFLAAQNLPDGTPWRPDVAAIPSAGRWAAVPSEQYAEAAVAVVLGAGALPSSARLTPGAIALVARWAANGADPPSADY